MSTRWSFSIEITLQEFVFNSSRKWVGHKCYNMALNDPSLKPNFCPFLWNTIFELDPKLLQNKYVILLQFGGQGFSNCQSDRRFFWIVMTSCVGLVSHWFMSKIQFFVTQFHMWMFDHSKKVQAELWNSLKRTIFATVFLQTILLQLPFFQDAFGVVHKWRHGHCVTSFMDAPDDPFFFFWNVTTNVKYMSKLLSKITTAPCDKLSLYRYFFPVDNFCFSSHFLIL